MENSLLPEQRIDAQGVPAEDMNPVHSLEAVGQFLRTLDVAQPQERIVELRVLDAVTIKLPSQPLVAVDVDLNLAREPALELDVDEPQIPVLEVVVEVETLVPRRLNVRRATVQRPGRTCGPAQLPTAGTPGPR